MTDIRKFHDEAIQASVDRVLELVPPDQPVAVVAAADGERIRALAYVRIGDEFSFLGELKKRWDSSKLEGEASVVWTPEF